MKRTKNLLQVIFFAPIVISALFAILCEVGIMEEGIGISEENNYAEFAITIFMELITLVHIPLALRLFKFTFIEKALKGNPHNLLVFGTIRITMLALPLIINTTLYYIFLSAAFGYMALILLLSMMFIFPSESRCKNEMGGFEFNKR